MRLVEKTNVYLLLKVIWYVAPYCVVTFGFLCKPHIKPNWVASELLDQRIVCSFGTQSTRILKASHVSWHVMFECFCATNAKVTPWNLQKNKFILSVEHTSYSQKYSHLNCEQLVRLCVIFWDSCLAHTCSTVGVLEALMY